MPRKAMSEILMTASKIKKKEEKIQYLRENYSKPLHLVLAYGLDPRVKFVLPLDESPDSDPPYMPCDPEGMEGALYLEARRLYLFCERPNDNLTENKRQLLFIRLLENIHPQDAKMILQIVRKKPPYKGITKALIDEAFGEYRD